MTENHPRRRSWRRRVTAAAYVAGAATGSAATVWLAMLGHWWTWTLAGVTAAAALACIENPERWTDGSYTPVEDDLDAYACVAEHPEWDGVLVMEKEDCG